jgi:hypothetical protein
MIMEKENKNKKTTAQDQGEKQQTSQYEELAEPIILFFVITFLFILARKDRDKQIILFMILINYRIFC